MPKLILPATEASKIEVRDYEKGNVRHVRALARYLYEEVPSDVVRGLLIGILPQLDDAQIDTIMYIRLRRLRNMTPQQLKEITKGLL